MGRTRSNRRTSRACTRPYRGRSWLALSACLAISSCSVDRSLGPPGKNMSGPVTTSSTEDSDGSDGETETGSLGDLPGCDPLADPEQECGPEMACDLTHRVCVSATGTGLIDEFCDGDQQCSPGLICASGRCRQPCDANLEAGCGPEAICSVAPDPIPGLCLPSCVLSLGNCTIPGDACKRVIGFGGQLWAACVENDGVGLTGDACEVDRNCSANHLCTASEFHVLPCTDQAARCCAPICDLLELPCFGLEPVCHPLEIPGQETAGFCGDA